MPIYTYHCENCGVQFERQQKFTDPHLTTCPECGHKSLRKVFVPVSIVFKGSGFYATDHRSPSGGVNNPPHTPSENESAKSKDKTETTKTEKNKITTAKGDSE